APDHRRLPGAGRTGHDSDAVFRRFQPIHERAQQSRATSKIPTALAYLDPARGQIEMFRAAELRQTPRALLHDLRNQTWSIPGVGKQLDRRSEGGRNDSLIECSSLDLVIEGGKESIRVDEPIFVRPPAPRLAAGESFLQNAADDALLGFLECVGSGE